MHDKTIILYQVAHEMISFCSAFVPWKSDSTAILPFGCTACDRNGLCRQHL